MLEAAHYSAAGARHKSAFALPKDYFDGDVNEPVLHTAVRAAEPPAEAKVQVLDRSRNRQQARSS